jgi:hypothetical protein
VQELLLELGTGVEIDLAREGDDDDAGTRFLRGDVELAHCLRS